MLIRILSCFMLLPCADMLMAFAQPTDDGEIIYALAELEALNMRRINHESTKTDENGEEIQVILVSNRCGEAKVEFSIKRATQTAPTLMEYQTSIGEWCNPPFDFSKAYDDHFMIIQNNEVLGAEIVFRDSDGQRVLLINQHTLDRWTSLVGNLHPSLTISNLSPPIKVYPSDYPDDPDVKAYVAKDDDLAFFVTADGEKYIGLTKGVYLGNLFPTMPDE